MLTGKLMANTIGQVSLEKTRRSFRLTGHTIPVNSLQIQCFFLSFQQNPFYGYMGLCKAAFILFTLSFPIKSPSLRIYGNLQGSTYTMQVNS